MRLIKEFNESINYLTEETKDPKKPNVFIEGVFLQSDLKKKTRPYVSQGYYAN
jgi:hypothetical protein